MKLSIVVEYVAPAAHHRGMRLGRLVVVSAVVAGLSACSIPSGDQITNDMDPESARAESPKRASAWIPEGPTNLPSDDAGVAATDLLQGDAGPQDAAVAAREPAASDSGTSNIDSAVADSSSPSPPASILPNVGDEVNAEFVWACTVSDVHEYFKYGCSIGHNEGVCRSWSESGSCAAKIVRKGTNEIRLEVDEATCLDSNGALGLCREGRRYSGNAPDPCDSLSNECPTAKASDAFSSAEFAKQLNQASFPGFRSAVSTDMKSLATVSGSGGCPTFLSSYSGASSTVDVGITESGNLYTWGPSSFHSLASTQGRYLGSCSLSLKLADP